MTQFPELIAEARSGEEEFLTCRRQPTGANRIKWRDVL